MFCSISLLALAAISSVVAQHSGAYYLASSPSAHHAHGHSRAFNQGNGAGAGPSTFITEVRKAASSSLAMQPFTSNGVLYQPVVVVVTVPPMASPSTVSQAPAANSPNSDKGPVIVPVTPTPAAATSAASSRVKKPAPSASGNPSSGAAAGGSGASSSLNAQIVQKVMPSSSSCGGGTAAAECITADAAAPLIAQSYSTYKITSKGAQAAILALIALESGELKFNQHYNGNAPALTGQGTRNMMSPSFVLQYGQALYGGSAGSDALTVMKKINSNEADSMASAAWFLATKCPSILQQFASDPDGAWTQYITSGSCIGTTTSGDRQQYWKSAKAALGV